MADGDMPIKKQLDRDVNRIGDSFVFPPVLWMTSISNPSLAATGCGAFLCSRKSHIGTT